MKPEAPYVSCDEDLGYFEPQEADARCFLCNRRPPADERIALLLEQIANSRSAKAPAHALWAVKDVASYLQCSQSKVRSYAAAGKLPVLAGVGRQLRFDPDAVKALARGEHAVIANVVDLLPRR